jgi:hypothetical protein
MSESIEELETEYRNVLSKARLARLQRKSGANTLASKASALKLQINELEHKQRFALPPGAIRGGAKGKKTRRSTRKRRNVRK